MPNCSVMTLPTIFPGLDKGVRSLTLGEKARLTFASYVMHLPVHFVATRDLANVSIAV
jgi:hypothetical protein